ncbi:hypothetical protein MNBD_ALPHA08-2428 [hydrothermal vent metagenome]|uniref:Uncharacterized protein n=1 Tax=hydrothermal vent metagenome TaxID=652676 RepID=A0A3B0R656_9ZZZZ
MYSVPQQLRDNRRRQYDIPTMRSPKVLSPEINEILHMLKAFEPAKTVETKGN